MNDNQNKVYASHTGQIGGFTIAVQYTDAGYNVEIDVAERNRMLKELGFSGQNRIIGNLGLAMHQVGGDRAIHRLTEAIEDGDASQIKTAADAFVAKIVEALPIANESFAIARASDDQTLQHGGR